MMPNTKKTRKKGYKCAICVDEDSCKPAVQCKEYRFCSECAQFTADRFEAAYASELEYPPKFVHDKLPIESFANFLRPDFLDAYRIKKVEYAVPIGRSVYCPHWTSVSHSEGDS
jgi:hypothetical protein